MMCFSGMPRQLLVGGGRVAAARAADVDAVASELRARGPHRARQRVAR